MDLVIGILIVDSLNTWGHPLLTFHGGNAAFCYTSVAHFSGKGSICFLGYQA